MFELYANHNQLTLRKREAVTSGSVNVCQVRFEFSEEWEGLTKTAVFKAGLESRSVPVGEDGSCTIPWEVLRMPKYRLYAGVCGTRNGELVLPTVWSELGEILPGAAPSGETRPPTPELWEQALAGKGDALAYDGLHLSLMSGKTPVSTVPITGGGGPGTEGPPGKPGADATINGVNTMTLVEGDNISFEQQGDQLTISSDVAVDETLVKAQDTGLGVKYPVKPISYEDYSGLTDAQKQDVAFLVDGMPAENAEANFPEVYSTQEARIGTWLGKPLYRRVYQATMPAINVEANIVSAPYVNVLVHSYCMVEGKAGSYVQFPNETGYVYFNKTYKNFGACGRVSDTADQPCTVVLEYTKAED